AARQDELLEARQLLVELIEIVLEACHLRVAHRSMTGNAELAAKIEQVVLHFGEAPEYALRGALRRQHDPERAVELIYGSIRRDARRILDGARAVAEAGRAVVPGARIDLAESMAHAIPR